MEGNMYKRHPIRKISDGQGDRAAKKKHFQTTGAVVLPNEEN